MHQIADAGREGVSQKASRALLPLVMLGLAGVMPAAANAGLLGSYLELKGGIYSPSATFNLGNVDLQSTFESDTQTGVNGEIAIGHFFLPTLALELGLGYFKGKGSVAAPGVIRSSHQVDFDVIPLLATVKAFIPVGAVSPYGELGVGAYFTKFGVSDNLNTFNGTTTFGLHTGAGLNVSIAPNMFMGIEGRYVWANPSFGDQKIKLNDTEYALNGFKLNGFTTTFGVGLNF